MKKALRDIFQAIANRPPVLWSAIGGVVTTLGGQVDALEPYREIMYIVIPSAFGYIASRFTVGPETGVILAKAALASKPADGEARARAIKVLDMQSVNG